jgi:hypothetical protein
VRLRDDAVPVPPVDVALMFRVSNPDNPDKACVQVQVGLEPVSVAAIQLEPFVVYSQPVTVEPLSVKTVVSVKAAGTNVPD